MHRAIAVAVAAFAVTLPATVAAARGDAGGSFGLGLMAGEPTGLTAQVRLGGSRALDLALGIDAFEGSDLYLHGDYIFELADLSHGGSVAVPLYLGVGVFLWDHDDGLDDLHIGPRVPFGLAIRWRDAPFQLFAEVAFRFVLLHGDDAHDHGAGFGGAVGFRFFF